MSILLNSIGTERIKSLYAARGAALYALNRVSDKAEAKSEGGSIFEGTQEEEEGEQETIKWVPNKQPYSIKIGDINCDVYLYDESGKLNINGATDENREIFKDYFIQRDILSSDADTIIDSILDWIDTNDLTHINGAEDDYYGSLPEPYKSKDAPFDSIEELSLIKGVTPELFKSIRNDMTVYGNEQIKVNINFASRETLLSIPGLSDSLVDELFLYIEENGTIADSEELRQMFWSLGKIGDSYEDIKQYITIDLSGYITIRAVCKESEAEDDGSDSQQPADGQSNFTGYEYKLIASKGDSGYKITAVYPE